MNERDDKDLQRYLDGDTEISRAYRSLARDEPPAALDAQILAAAAAEAKRPRRPAWMVPVALAATLVLGIGLSLEQIGPEVATMSERDALPAAPDALGSADSDAAPGALDAPSRRPQKPPPPDFSPALEISEPSPVVLADAAEPVPVDAENLRREALQKQRDELRRALESATPQLRTPLVQRPNSDTAQPRSATTHGVQESMQSVAESASAPATPESSSTAPLDNALRSSDTAANRIRQSAARSDDEPARAQDSVIASTADDVAEQEVIVTGRRWAAKQEEVADAREVTAQQKSRADRGLSSLAATADERDADASAAAGFAPAPGYRRATLEQKALETRYLDSLGDDPDAVVAAIAGLHRRGDEALARRLLSLFLERHPDYRLADDYPLPDPRAAPAPPASTPPR